MFAPALLLSLSLGTASAQAAGPCSGCNVLWLVIDTTRHDYLGMYGNPDGNTPKLDAFAAGGRVFESAWSQGPDTMISVSSYFTGRYNRNTDMDFTIFNRKSAFHPMSPELTTVAEVLQGQGYQTVGMTANLVIAGDQAFDLGLHQGFDVWKKGTDTEVADFGVAQLDALKGSPFFLYLHLMGPHHPNSMAPDFAKRRGPPPADRPEANQHLYREINKGRLTLSKSGAAHVRDLYADALWAADAELGRVLARLEALGLTDNTLVIITSDHGESLGEIHNGRPIYGHGHALTEPLLHVPLVLRGKGVPQGRDAQVAELVDLAPTITTLLGIPEDPSWQWDGDPLVGPGAAPGTLAIADRGIPGKSNANARTATHSVRWWEAANQWIYMDLTRATAPEATHVDADAEHKRLQALLQSYIDTAHPPKSEGTTATPEGDTLDQLRELGYVE